jgi:glycosyltransferase involved in cell wall biosynthesis
LSGLRRILILSIWNDPWSLGEGSGVPDEMRFIRRFRDAGVELHFLIPEPPGETDGRDVPGVFFHTYVNVFRRARVLPSAVRRLVVPYVFTPAVFGDVQSAVDSVAPDLMLGFSHYSIEPLSRMSRRTGISAAVKLFGVMYLARGDLPRLRRWWLNFDQERALRHPLDGYIVLDDGTMGDRALIERGIDPAKIHYLPNGMEMEWADVPVDTSAARSELGLPPGRTLIVTVSRLVRLKRVDLLLDAFSKIARPVRDKAALVVAGDGPERRGLEDLACSLGISGHTIFTGAIPYDSMPRLLKSCDIFAATGELTNSSMPPCEAMLCGLPVVAFDVAGTSGTVRHGETGLLAGNGDVLGITSALERLVTDPRMRDELGRGAARHASEHFMSWDERTGLELRILEELASGGGSRG